MLQHCSELAYVVKFWYRHVFVFADRCLHLLPVRLQLLEHCTFNYHLPVFGHQQIDYTTFLKRNAEVLAFPSKLVFSNTLEF
jgi:hypothetical protein